MNSLSIKLGLLTYYAFLLLIICGSMNCANGYKFKEKDNFLNNVCINGYLQANGDCLCFPGFNGKFCTEINNKLRLPKHKLTTSLFSNLLDYDFDEPDPKYTFENNPYGYFEQIDVEKQEFDSANFNSMNGADSDTTGLGRSSSVPMMIEAHTSTRKTPVRKDHSSMNETHVDVSSARHGFSGSDESYEPKTGQQKCVNGIPMSFNMCICHFGYTGVSCDISMINSEHEESGFSSGNGSGDEQQFDTATTSLENGGSGFSSGKGSQEEQQSLEDATDRKNGFASGDGSGQNPKSETGSGYAQEGQSGDGIESEYEHQWAKTPMDKIYWEPIWRHEAPTKEVIDEDNILEDTFVAISTGVSGSKTELHVGNDVKSMKPNGKVYRFTFAPEVEGKKSRLEIVTCFSTTNDIISRYNRIPEELEYLLKSSCPIIDLPPGNIHTHEYEIYIPRADFRIDGEYILTQWHGSPDPTILQDEMGCVAQVPISNLHKICTKGRCKQGAILDRNGHYIGIRYNQGGYPPLSFKLEKKQFIIVARSDEMLFIGKGGCGQTERCVHHPRMHNNIIWKFPAEKFKFDQWVKFRWDIKWSEYSSSSLEFDNGGMRTSDAWIRVWMNGEKIVDWIGPCGRNDYGKTPYFKAGIYNPSGSTFPIRFFFRRYSHEHEAMDTHKDEEVKKTFKKLRICSNNAKDINQNAIKNSKHYRFILTSSASDKKCTLYSKVDHLSFLRNAKLNRMLVDDATKSIITNLVYALDDQAHLIKHLEKRLEQYESEQKTTNEEILDYDGF
ncbi:uncharacterized protein LOC120347141 isoform X1 [Styela clava]